MTATQTLSDDEFDAQVLGKVVERKERDAASYVILVKRNGRKTHPWVTWVQGKASGNCFWGHYKVTEYAARDDFEER